MKTFIGTKLIQAKPMTRKEYNDLRGWQIPQDENPNDEGYLVMYPDSPNSNVKGFDGYVSWSPKEVFEKVYRNKNFTFGDAIVALKKGKSVTRAGWNGKGMYLLLIKGDTITEQINDCYGDPTRYDIGSHGYEKGTSIPVLDAIYMKTADNKLVAWLASQTDVLAEDWEIKE